MLLRFRKNNFVTTGNNMKARAFTLLELLLVMAILISLAVVVWPDLSASRASGRLENVADQLASLMKMARSGAMSTGSKYRCVFEVDGRLAVIEQEVDPLDSPGIFEPLSAHWARLDMGAEYISCLLVEFEQWEGLLKKEETAILDEIDKVEDSYISEPIVFYPDGTCDSVTVVIGDGEGNLYTLILNGLTGQIQMEQGRPAELEVLNDILGD